MGAVLVVLLCWAVASVVASLVAGATFRRRDRQIPVVLLDERRPPVPDTIVIPEPRSACRAETEARLPSR